MGGLFNTAANLIIVTGYLLVPALWLPWLPLQRWVLLSGSVFFLTCAITHLGLAFHARHDAGWMQVNHVVQAVAVMGFVSGFGRQLRKAHERGKASTDQEEIR
jgi:hypothetical protein